jgi:hypothetical protein
MAAIAALLVSMLGLSFFIVMVLTGTLIIFGPVPE